MGEVIAARSLNGLYIYLDIAFLLLLGAFLWFSKRRTAVLFGVAGGLLYFAVDYGIFYLALGTRTVTGANTALFLLWLSMSYGFTNFVWIWLMLDRDKHRVEWSIFILAGWFASSLLSQNFGSSFAKIEISRGTNTYHGVMALILFVGYAGVLLYNLLVKDKAKRVPTLYICAIGIAVQLGWEFTLLVTGIRPQGILPLVVNSLIETNLGLPPIYAIHRFITKRWNEDFSRRVPGQPLPTAGPVFERKK